MCGIIGQVGGKKEALERGLGAMRHRGPDGQHIVNDGSVTFGHARLSIIDLAARSDQPMRSGSGKSLIAFNGEIYNYRELREELAREGVRFKTEGDTEVLLEGYEKHGAAFFEKLRGMWAFAIYDTRNGSLVLARDRFGIKPLYYSTEGGELSFASEIRAIKDLLPRVTPNTERYYQFFNLGYFLPPHTHLREVKKLLPGEVLTWSLATHTLISHTLASVEAEQPTRSFEESVSSIEDVLKESVRAHFIADVPVGLLLSGGTDSSLMAALAIAAGEKPLLFNLAIEGSPDAGYAADIAKHLGQELGTVPLSQALLAEGYEQVLGALDEPTADPSIIPTSLIFNAIKGKAKVVLSGEGGDEWFGGYLRHHHLTQVTRVREDDPLAALEWFKGASSSAMRYWNPLVSRKRDFILDHILDDAIGSYLKEVKTIDFPIASEKIRHNLASLYHDAPTAACTPIGLFFDRFAYLPDDLMHKADASSMAASIEARVPFLDKEVRKAVERVDSRFCLSREYVGKVILKRILERHLPKELVYRPKSGFSFSFERYAREAFRADLFLALAFHRDHAAMFGLSGEKILPLLTPENTDLIARKFPRFAFGLISNHRCFGS
jgi:asparagine synthase (glutamine-hydrolysing)